MSTNDDSRQVQERQIQDLTSEINEKETAIQQLELEIQRLNRGLNAVNMQLADLQADLEGSLAYRLLNRYHRLMERLLPIASRRRLYYNRVMNFVRRLLHVGRPAGPPTPAPAAAQTRPATEDKARIEKAPSSVPNKDDVIVYQMGKVGSVSVQRSLSYMYERMGSAVQVYHVHNLNYLDEIEAQFKARRYKGKFLQDIKGYRALRSKIDNDPKKKWKLISLVREPVARNVARFFFIIDDLVPDWRERWRTKSLSLPYLQELFLDPNLVDHDTPDTWFDGQMLPLFGIDVFAEPFPKELGYKIYGGARQASLLLIRLENLTACAPTVMKEFLGLDGFVLRDANLGDNRDYAELYSAFRRQPLPEEYVHRIYGTRFARHFYTDQEIEKFTHIWTALKNS